jgi:hypothetical protein
MLLHRGLSCLCFWFLLLPVDRIYEVMQCAGKQCTYVQVLLISHCSGEELCMSIVMLPVQALLATSLSTNTPSAQRMLRCGFGKYEVSQWPFRLAQSLAQKSRAEDVIFGRDSQPAGPRDVDDFMSGAVRPVPKPAADGGHGTFLEGDRSGGSQRFGESGGFVVCLVGAGQCACMLSVLL